MAFFAVMAAAVVALAAQQPDFEHLYRQAITQREQTLGKDAAKTRESARDLALYLALRGEYARAASYIEPAIELTDTTAGATALHNWAVSVEERDPALAERMYGKALAIRVKALPALDVELATTRLNLASLLMARGDAQAGKLASAALAAFEKKLGPTDARTGAASGVLCAALATQGDVVSAERLFRRALAVAEKVHGPSASPTASALENLADLLAQTGRESAARPLLDRAQRIRAGTR
jgi:tetratricopeptide (TPR) repeat protein